jgi:hypothetical protein
LDAAVAVTGTGKAKPGFGLAALPRNSHEAGVYADIIGCERDRALALNDA